MSGKRELFDRKVDEELNDPFNDKLGEALQLFKWTDDEKIKFKKEIAKLKKQLNELNEGKKQ